MEKYGAVIDNFQQLDYSKKMLIKHFNESKSHLSPNDNIIAYLLHEPHTMEFSSKAEPITMKFFTVFLMLFGYCVCICVAVFILENLSRISVTEFVFNVSHQFVNWYVAARNKIMRVWFSRQYGFPLSYIS